LIDAESIQYLLAAAVVALGFKIVWDWLQIRKGGTKVVKPCKEDEMCHTVTKMKEQQIRMDEREKGMIRQLADGRENFAGMQSDITEIKGNVAAIVAVINERDKSGKPLLQN